MCLESTADTQLTISFDFHDEKNTKQALSVRKYYLNYLLIYIDNIENLNSIIMNIRRRLDIIHSNMRNSAVRRTSHLESTLIN